MTLQEVLKNQNIDGGSLSVKDLKELKYTLKAEKQGKRWANFKLHNKFGFSCDSDNCGFCGNYGACAGGDPPLARY